MTARIYRFGDCSVDPAAREMRRAGGIVTLSPKVFDCLAYLIEHRDRAVGRDELIAAVWGKVDVSDTLLGQTVLKARRSVGDTGNAQNAIRTIPRFGYRWVAELDPSSDADAASDPAGIATPAPSRNPPTDPSMNSALVAPADAAIVSKAGPSRSRWIALMTIVLIAATAVSIGLFRSRPEPVATTSIDTTGQGADIALVLPVDVNAADRWSWLRLGLMDLVAGRLRSAGQTVVPSDNVVALTHAKPVSSDPARLRAATGARFVITPFAVRGDKDWLVRLQLDTGNGASREVEARNADVTEAARAASDRLLALLGRHAPGTSNSPDLSASELLSRAESALLSDDLDSARRLLESASPQLKSSPEFGLRLARIDFRAGQFDAARARVERLLDEVGAETNPVLHARLLNARGAVNIHQDRIAAGGQDYAAAIALLENRDQPAALGQAYTGRGVSEAAEGHYDLALADFSRARIALELAGDTLALARVEANEGVINAQRNRFPEALAIDLSAAGRFENFGALNELAATLGNAAEAELALLQPKDALTTLDHALPALKHLENLPTRHGFDIVRVLALAANGRLSEARALLGELADAVPADGDAALLARVHSAQARFEFGDGNAKGAATLAAAAVAALSGHDYLRDRADAWLILVRALRADGRNNDAKSEIARMTAWAAREPDSVAPLFAKLAAAEQLSAERDADAARGSYDAALDLAGRSAVPVDLAAVVVSYGSRLIAAGELERAGSVVGQVARFAGRDYACTLLQAALYRALDHRAAWRSALAEAGKLAGERLIPASIATAPVDSHEETSR